jgi:3-hydroxybutyryl-CoA dehydratase
MVAPLSAWGDALPDVLEASEGVGEEPVFNVYPRGKTISELSVGDSATFTKTISQADINQFAVISGDDNPAHVNEEWASGTRLGTRVAHGMLTGGLISAALGTTLPGPGSIYLSQSLRWVAPVYPGDQLTAKVTVASIDEEKRRVVLDTVVEKDDEPVLTGEALVMPPSK